MASSLLSPPQRPDLTEQEEPSAVPAGSRKRREATAAALLAAVGWAAALWLSTHVHADPTPAQVALFAHLASLVAGLGGVLAVDYLAVLWLLGRRTLRQVLTLSTGISGLVWAGLIGLIASGALLAPDLSSPLTQLKLALVMLVALNGAAAIIVQHRLTQASPHPPRPLMLQAVATTTLSQTGWWGAAIVGFLNTQC